MSEAQALIQEIEAAAKAFDMKPTTIGKEAGQGGHFYRRLKSGRRFWPETAVKVRTWIEAERARRSHSSGSES